MTLVDDARQAWRWWSVRLAVVAGLLSGLITQYPDVLPQLLNLALPVAIRPYAPLLVTLITTGAAILTRILKQGSKPDGNTA